MVEGQVLADANLKNLILPNPHHEKIFANIEEDIVEYNGRF